MVPHFRRQADAQRGQLIFSLWLIVGGGSSIAVRRHVSYPLREHRCSDEIVQVIAGTILILFGAV
jgi:hypothetical protein